MSPNYSIIIPVYNQERFIRQCLDSIVTQTVKDFEVIIIDDGSTDKSGAICDEYARKDSRITVIHKDNEGVSIARNKGLDIAKGKWVSFVDSDDFVEPDYLEVFNRIEDKADLTYFGNRWVFYDGCGKSYSLPQKCYSGWTEIQKGILSLKQNYLCYDFYGYTWNKFFKNQIIQDYGIRFVPHLYMKEDEIFVDDFVIHSNSIATINDILYSYRWTENGLTCLNKSYDCLSSYVNNSERILNKYSYKSLKKYQIGYIYDILICMFNIKNQAISTRLVIHKILDFVRRYKDECEFDIHSMGRAKWAFWNYDSSLKAKLFVYALWIKNNIRLTRT